MPVRALPRGFSPRLAGVLLLVLALGLIVSAGWRGQRSEPADFVESPGQGTPEARRDALSAHLDRNPRDGRAWVLLGLLELDADRFEAAGRAFERALSVSPKVAADPSVWCEYADALGMAQGGSLVGKPTELIEHALSLRANHPKALEMAGSAAYERRDFERAAGYWRRLLPLLPEGSRQRAEVAAAIERSVALAAARP